MNLAGTTQEVLDHHLAAFGGGDLEAILEDYAENSIIITTDGIHRTRDEMSAFFSALFAEFAKPGMSFNLDHVAVEGETAFIAWSADTADNVYNLGTDTFTVRDGKIAAQTFVAYTTAK